MLEVEAQSVRRNQRSFLVNVLTKHGAKRGVQKMGRRVVAFGVATTVARHGGARRTKRHFPRTFPERSDASVDAANFIDLDGPVFSLNLTTIRDLTAGFHIERRLSQHHRDPSIRQILLRDYACLHIERIVSNELGAIALV